MASPIAFLRRNRGAALTAAGAGAAVIGYAALRHARPIEAMPPGSGAVAGGAATTPADPSAAIAQGASIALQGAGLGLGVAQGGLDLAGLATTAAAGIAETLAGSQEAMGQTLGQVAQSAIGILPSLAPAAGYPAQPVTPPQPLPPTPLPAPAPTPTPAPAPAPAFLRYEVAITGAGTVRGYIVGSTCALTARTLSFSRASFAPVARRVCSGRVTWKTLAGGYSGVSYVAGLSTGPWTIRKVFRSASGAITYQTIGQTGS